MREDERDRKRAVNPAMRRDPPRPEPAAPDAESRDGPTVKGTQGAEPNPVDEGGILE